LSPAKSQSTVGSFDEPRSPTLDRLRGGRRVRVRWFVFDGQKISWMENPGGKERGSLVADTVNRVDVDPEKYGLSHDAHVAFHSDSLLCTCSRNKFCLRLHTRDFWLKVDDESTTGEWCVAAQLLLVSCDPLR
jgi:hypothetical protein